MNKSFADSADCGFLPLLRPRVCYIYNPVKHSCNDCKPSGGIYDTGCA